MMKIAGHTMGTPEYTLEEAIRLFKEIGLDGVEIIIAQDGYSCAIAQDADDEQVFAVRKLVEDAGLEVAGITPYLNQFNDLDEDVRAAECAALRRVIDMAELLGTKNIRIYGGKFLPGEEDPKNKKMLRLVQSMRECGDYAAEKGICLNMENHFGTMTLTAAGSAEIAEAIHRPNVGILYDQANLAFLPAEEYDEAIELQKKYIKYVHVKDLVYKNGSAGFVCSEVAKVNEDERTVSSRVPGEGILDWKAILTKLKSVGYDGWLSLEYERRWHPQDLPDAAEGMKRGGAFVRNLLREIGG